MLANKNNSKHLEVVDIGNGDSEITDLLRIRVKSESDVMSVIQSGVSLILIIVWNANNFGKVKSCT